MPLNSLPTDHLQRWEGSTFMSQETTNDYTAKKGEVRSVEKYWEIQENDHCDRGIYEDI